MTTPITVIITGAGGGLGKVTATAFLASGANVAICDVNQERLASTSKEWTEAGHDGKFLATNTDVTDPASVQELVAATVAKFGRLDVLVNNAGIIDDFSAAAECTPEMWTRIMSVNLFGPYLLIQAAIKQITKQTDGAPGGVIINVCSAASTTGYSAGASYTASKHGMLGLSRNTAFHYSDKGIYSIAMVMGGMLTNLATEMLASFDQQGHANARSYLTFDATKHLVPLDSVAKYILFLSDRDIARSANGSAVDFKNNWPAN